MSPSENPPPSDRATVRRLPERGRYDAATIHAILDEGLVAHVAFAVDGRPVVIPTAYARLGGEVVIHGSVASRLFGTLGDGVELCLAVTLLDGVVLARSIFNHSMNYRSVVVFGRARRIEGRERKRLALRALTEHLVPGRWEDARQPSGKELDATEVLAVPLDEASAKVRVGPPGDLAKDMGLDVWAGVVPLTQQVGAPVPAPEMAPDAEPPPYASGYRRPTGPADS